MMMRHKQPEPLLKVMCRCGAVWYGRYIYSLVIADHRQREAAGHRLGCHVTGPVAMTSDEQRKKKRGCFRPARKRTQ